MDWSERDTLNLTLRRVLADGRRAYIYALCSRSKRVVYIGQTNDPGGVCARLAAHIGNNGTFRVRLYEQGWKVEQIDDLELFAFALPEKAAYTSRDEVYREGVEYNVQSRLQRERGEWTPPFRLISNITAPDTVDFPEVTSLAEAIYSQMHALYHVTAV